MSILNAVLFAGVSIKNCFQTKDIFYWVKPVKITSVLTILNIIVCTYFSSGKQQQHKFDVQRGKLTVECTKNKDICGDYGILG